jgi:hypothetical protein
MIATIGLHGYFFIMHLCLPFVALIHPRAVPYAIPDTCRCNISQDRSHHRISSFQFDIIDSGDAAGSAIHHVSHIL